LFLCPHLPKNGPFPTYILGPSVCEPIGKVYEIQLNAHSGPTALLLFPYATSSPFSWVRRYVVDPPRLVVFPIPLFFPPPSSRFCVVFDRGRECGSLPHTGFFWRSYCSLSSLKPFFDHHLSPTFDVLFYRCLGFPLAVYFSALWTTRLWAPLNSF